MVRNTDKDELYEMFPLPCRCFETRGFEDGMILRFKTFYLKIYDHECEDSYIIKGYRYNEQNPVFEETIESIHMREFAAQFTQEDSLARFQKPCDNP